MIFNRLLLSMVQKYDIINKITGENYTYSGRKIVRTAKKCLFFWKLNQPGEMSAHSHIIRSIKIIDFCIGINITQTIRSTGFYLKNLFLKAKRQSKSTTKSIFERILNFCCMLQRCGRYCVVSQYFFRQ